MSQQSGDIPLIVTVPAEWPRRPQSITMDAGLSKTVGQHERGSPCVRPRDIAHGAMAGNLDIPILPTRML